jgi:hypothetical protein
MKITQELRAFALEQAGRRCECTGSNCRHHLSGARCRHGLREDDWKVFWHSEDGGATRENLEAWCLECFDNNFDAPRETVALLSVDISDYPKLIEENRRQAITLKSVLRDSAGRVADDNKGRMVLDRVDDDILVEFPKGRNAVNAAKSLYPGFRDLAGRLKLPVPEIRGAIHCGEVTRWRNGLLVGDAVDVASSLASRADAGQIVVTGSAVPLIKIGIHLEPVAEGPLDELPSIQEIWAMTL